MIIRNGLAAAALLLALSVQAHTHLTMSMPADKSVVTKAPDHVMLSFSEEARVTSLTLQKGSEKAQTLGPLPAKAAKDVTVTLPPLTPGEYVVNWRVAGADSHVMSGKFAFTVATMSMPASAK